MRFVRYGRSPPDDKLSATMAETRWNMLDPPVDVGRDHVLGPPDAEMTLVEYGSYACPHCHAVHEVIEGLRPTPILYSLSFGLKW